MQQPRSAMSGQRILGVGICAAGLIVLAIALIIGIGFPKFVYETNLKAVCIQDASHPRYDLWVNESFFTVTNRLYYWHLVNADDFLYHSAFPQVVERGPYVYQEIVHQKVGVQFISTTTQFYVWRKQLFDAETTRKECGSHCSEHDNITVVNQDYLRSLTEAGGERQLAGRFMPNVIRRTIRRLLQSTSGSSVDQTTATGRQQAMYDVMSLLGQPREELIDRWSVELNYPPVNFTRLSFAAWLSDNSTDDKRKIAAGRAAQLSWTPVEMSALYSLLTQCHDLLSDAGYYCIMSNVASETVPKVYQLLMTTNASGACGCDTNCSNSAEVVEQISTALCTNVMTSCLLVPAVLADVFVRVLKVYVTEHLAWFVFYQAVIFAGHDLVVTRSQSSLALGDGFVRGLLESYDDYQSAINRSSLVTIYNCYDAIYATSNGQWKAYNSLTSSTPSQFPRAASKKRQISRSIRDTLPPSLNLSACLPCTTVEQTQYNVFLPEFFRTVVFSVQPDSEHATPLNRLYFDSGNLMVDGQFIFYQGLQDMSDVNKFESWITLPHFLYASADIQSLFNTTANLHDHLPYKLFEPMTGLLWEDKVRHQLCVGVSLGFFQSNATLRSRQLRISYYDKPIPLWWIEKRISITEQGVDDFYSRVGTYMTTSCGGLVGLTTLALIIMGIGLLAATITVRNGKVAPIIADNVSFF